MELYHIQYPHDDVYAYIIYEDKNEADLVATCNIFNQETTNYLLNIWIQRDRQENFDHPILFGKDPYDWKWKYPPSSESIMLCVAFILNLIIPSPT